MAMSDESAEYGLVTALIFCITILILVFAGEPDIHDGLVHILLGR